MQCVNTHDICVVSVRLCLKMGGKVSFPIIEIPTERIFVVTGANTGMNIYSSLISRYNTFLFHVHDIYLNF